jgi:hypothetical protein
LPAFQFAWQPAVGIELGKTFDVGSSSERSTTVWRQRVDLRLDARLNKLANLLRIPTVIVFLQSTYWHLPGEDADEFTYSKAGSSFQITPELSLEMSYSVGHDSPNFRFSRSGIVGFGIKF